MLLIGLGPGCSIVFDLGSSPPEIPPLDVQAGGTVPTFSGGYAPRWESCNGIDDDGDGLVDEGFTDYDGDGLADCDGPTCPDLDRGTPGTVPLESSCAGNDGAAVVDPWAASVRWSVSSAGGGAAAFGTPTVGQLDDDDGDGIIDGHDTPDVILQTAAADPACLCTVPGETIALDGATGAEKWRHLLGGGGSGSMLADIDGDGVPNVLTSSREGALQALTSAGALVWTANPTASLQRTRAPITADLHGDGGPEVIYGNLVINGRNGEVEAVLDEPSPAAPGVAAVADLDLDGTQEILFQGAAFDPEGKTIWRTDARAARGLWPVVVQADDDERAEVVWIGSTFGVYDSDGTPLATTTTYSGEAPSPPCAGDIDDDGHVEVAWVDRGVLYAYDLDGTQLWAVSVGGSVSSGCSTFDLDADRGAEVLVATDAGLAVFDGLTGSRRFLVDTFSSPDPGSYPVVVDLDGDDHAEIVVSGMSAQGASVVSVIGHDGGGWASAGGSWPTYDYAVGNLLPGGVVPRRPGPWWAEYGAYRGRPAGDVVGRPDLLVQITDVCVADCSFGPARLALQVANQGGRDQYAGGIATVYALDGVERRPVAEVTLPAVPAGSLLAGVEVELAPGDIGPDGFAVEVQARGSDADFLADCEPDNQEDTWFASLCP